MAEVFIGPQSQALVAAGTVVSGAPGSTTSAVLTLPLADSYAFVLNVTAITGTSPTLDVALQVTPDGGTTWFDWLRWAEVTGNTAVTRRMIVQPIQGRGEAATEAAITAGTTNSVLIQNVPMPGALSQIRFRYTIGGTSPNYTLGIFMFAQVKQSAI